MIASGLTVCFVFLTLGIHADRDIRAAVCVVELLDQLLFDGWRLRGGFPVGWWEERGIKSCEVYSMKYS